MLTNLQQSKCLLTCSLLVRTNLAWLVVTNMAIWPKLVAANLKSVGHLDDPHYFPLKSYTYVIFWVLWVIF